MDGTGTTTFQNQSVPNGKWAIEFAQRDFEEDWSLLLCQFFIHRAHFLEISLTQNIIGANKG